MLVHRTSTGHVRTAALVAAICLLLTAVGAAPPASAVPPDGVEPFARGQNAIDRLGDRLPDVARANGMTAASLRLVLRNDPTLAVDRSGGLAYFDELAPGEPAGAETSSGPVAAPPTTGAEFQLASNPGAEKTIYLDFDGHVTEGTTWNGAYGVTTIVSPPYDTDGDPESWSTAELQVIRDSWAVAAEDFAPWNVNVTTIDPGVEALRRSGTGDTEWGARVVITDDTFANCGCGGHAYIGSFDDTADEPTFVYNSSFVGVSEAITHEVGHMLGLAHDGTSTAGYYTGHDGVGDTGWAPIMGVAYYQPVGQWSQQEYFDANNTGSGANYGRGVDDIAIISSLTNGNNFGLRPDDHGDHAGAATALLGGTPSATGIIETRTDIDVFGFTTTGGQVAFTALPADVGPNLDIEMTVRDSGGAIVATANPIGLLSATIDMSLAAGSYTVEIDGVGVGTPGANPPSGYTDYGSLGRYTLTGNLPVGPPDTDPPAAPIGVSATESGGDVTVAWTSNVEADLAGYVVRRSATSGGPYTDIANPSSNGHIDTDPAVGVNYYVVVAVDLSGNVSPDSAEVSADVPLLPQNATGQTPVYGTVDGGLQATWSRDGVSQSITEVESGGRPNRRHDRAEHRWTVPAAQGNQTLTVVATATDAGDADNGFSIEWSADGSTWIPLDVVSVGNPVDGTYPIGAPSGTFQVRVIDTDRTATNRSLDTVSVDLIEVVGDGGPGDPVDPTMALASISTSTQGAGRGNQYGVATVQVNDELGSPVSGAAVTVRFSGDFDETVIAVTDGSGTATARTVAAVKKPGFTACVALVSAPGLTYEPGTEGCP